MMDRDPRCKANQRNAVQPATALTTGDLDKITAVAQVGTFSEATALSDS